MDAKQSRIRHLAKTITWRVVGTVDTVLVGWLGLWRRNHGFDHWVV